MNMLKAFFLMLLATTTNLLAHDLGGCACCQSHPAVTPQHGGMMEESDKAHIFVELLLQGNQLSIFAFEHSGKPINTQDISISTEMELPRRFNVKQEIPLQAQDHVFKGTVTIPDEANRVTFHTKINYKGKEDTLSFTQEK